MSAVPVSEPVALHPERTDDPATLLWRVAGPALHGVDEAAVRDLARAADGTEVLAAVEVGTDHVLTTLDQDRSWPVEAATVRSAVRRAVATSRDADRLDPDAALGRAARRALDEVAPYAAGHGGSIALERAAGGVVEVRMAGACHGCPAAAFTLQGRVARLVREDAPWLTEVRVCDGARD